MKKFFQSLWDRIVVNYKPTLIGLATGIGILVLDSTVEALQALPQGWAKVAAAVAIAAGAWLRSKPALPPATP